MKKGVVDNRLYGGIEAGGTKFMCMIASSPNDVFASARFPTTVPEETLECSLAFFQDHSRKYPISALGIASFGPLDLDPESPTYGYITTTPKLQWSNTDITRKLKTGLNVPVVINTDVNAAALAEYIWGGEQKFDPLLYITIGTGIGGGCIVRGKPIHGLIHPEMGHLRIPQNREEDPFEGICPYHRNCFEGLASGPAMQARWGLPAEQLPDDHPAWDLEAFYIASALVNLILSFSPRRIVLGGGVMSQFSLFSKIRTRVKELLAGYLYPPAILDQLENIIIPAVLKDKSGVLGAIALAMCHFESFPCPD
ncbi:MAG: ROK family protein [Anaerolineales bacterium]